MDGSKSTVTEPSILLDAYAEAGGTFIDTVDMYGKGLAEEYIGAWLVGNEQVTAPIVGARTVEQLREDLDAASLRLSDDQRVRLDDAKRR